MDLHFGSTSGSPRHPWVRNAPRTNKLHTRGLTMSTFPQFQRRQSVTTSHFELFVIQMQFSQAETQICGKMWTPVWHSPRKWKMAAAPVKSGTSTPHETSLSASLLTSQDRHRPTIPLHVGALFAHRQLLQQAAFRPGFPTLQCSRTVESVSVVEWTDCMKILRWEFLETSLAHHIKSVRVLG